MSGVGWGRAAWGDGSWGRRYNPNRSNRWLGPWSVG